MYIHRDCACATVGRDLCGPCTLADNHAPWWPGLTASRVRHWFRRAATALAWPEPNTWASHALRRGAGRDAERAGGMPALLAAGGWKGAAAFGYLEAQRLGAMAAAEYLLSFSSDEDSDA